MTTVDHPLGAPPGRRPYVPPLGSAQEDFQRRSASSVASLIDELREATIARIENIESAQVRHEDRVDSRLLRYEDSQREQTNRIIDALKGLAALESVPDRLTEIEGDISEVKDRLTSVEGALKIEEARKGERTAILRGFIASGNFFIQHGWKLAIIAYFLIDAGAKYLQANPPLRGLTSPEQVGTVTE